LRSSRTLRTSRYSAAAPSPRDALLVVASGSAAAIVVILPTLAMQLAIVLGAAAVTVAAMMARAGRILNPAWLVVALLYVLGAIGSLLSHAGIGLSAPALVLMGASPFAIAALVIRPESRARLLLLAPLLLLLLLAVLSLGWSEDAQQGSAKLTLWTLTALVPVAFILVLAPGPSGVSWRLIGGAALVYALGLLVFGASSPLYPGRAILFDSNPIWVARAAFVGALVVLFGPFPSVAKLVMAPVMIVAGLTTVSLGPAVGLVVGAWAGAAETLRCSDRTDRRVKVGWAALASLTGLAAVVLLSGALDPLLAQVANDPNTTSRATYLDVAGRLVLGAPVFGVGIGGFAATGLDTYPHNLFAEVASELGLAGIMALVVWLALALRGAARSPILVALVVSTGTFAMFSGSLAGNEELWMFSALAVATLPIGVASWIGSEMARPARVPRMSATVAQGGSQRSVAELVSAPHARGRPIPMRSSPPPCHPSRWVAAWPR
jgi:O-antigen ligase